MKVNQTNLARWWTVAVMALLLTLAGCVKPGAGSKAGPRDRLLGWYKMGDTIIPVFKRDGTYYSVCRGGEVPLKECPDGLEWALTPSSMTGTKIGFNEVSNVYYIVIEDWQLEHNWESYVSGQKQPMTRTSKPSGLLDATVRPPRANKDFVGWYQAVWLPLFRIEIRKSGNQSFNIRGALWQPGGWMPFAEPCELIPLPDQLGFDCGRDHTTRLVYDQVVKRFEYVNADSNRSPVEIRMPLARVSAPSSSEGGRAPSPMMPIGIPSWH